MVVLSPSLSLFSSNQFLRSPNLLFFRNQPRTMMNHKNRRLHDMFRPCSTSSSNPTSQNGFVRRDLMLFGLSSSALVLFPSSGSIAEEDIKMASLVDEINSYSYLYPVELPSKKLLFKWVESRKPERYSSAAPLSPDARLRIVSERVDIIDNLIISVSIGPPNSVFIKSQDKKAWTAKDVADSVLSDKSALPVKNVVGLFRGTSMELSMLERVTSSQRMTESSLLDAHSSEIDGEPYWYYEYLVRKSPTKTAQESNLYRHYVASTAERDGRTLML
ncbi:hypothetical protein FEM48_Zijuj06G0154900 [Ziziphus jujuba var. spinosa]|uniref:PsbP domain-containing protein 5, chloroplastic n=1 Tax=Ziziphus jujuba var. spinosa TaxID=714518 RepID=A0A978VA39_ZIZJJ|nr:hypothetical protein FEM48_Zijuj06G0154900 [Ziziphus jujuba var. spinosa]